MRDRATASNLVSPQSLELYRELPGNTGDYVLAPGSARYWP